MPSYPPERLRESSPPSAPVPTAGRCKEQQTSSLQVLVSYCRSFECAGGTIDGGYRSILGVFGRRGYSSRTMVLPALICPGKAVSLSANFDPGPPPTELSVVDST